MKPLVGRVIQWEFLLFFLVFEAAEGGGEDLASFGDALVGGHVVGVGFGGDHWRNLLRGEQFLVCA
ncbi:MAG: hypothetical protein HQM04_18405 [Magnetococcales bacterium]|nr:hypothetical protein [Magnetococcales bacterium]